MNIQNAQTANNASRNNPVTAEDKNIRSEGPRLEAQEDSKESRHDLFENQPTEQALLSSLNPQGKKARTATVQKANQSAQVKGKGNIQENDKQITVKLSNGKEVKLDKYSTYQGKKYYYTSLVDKNGKARVTGKLSPQIEEKMRKFLDNIEGAIKKQEKKVAELEQRSWLKNSPLGDGKLKAAKAELEELKRMKKFGIRFFYDMEASNKGKGKAVLAQYQAGPGAGKYDGYGVIDSPEKVENMRKIYHRSNAATVKEVQESKEFYRGLSVR
jgi:hypothetical protein